MTGVVSDANATGMGSYVVGAVTTLIWRATSLAMGVGAVVATLLYFKQDSMMYFPEIGGIPRRPSQNPRRYRSPGEHQIPFEDHKIECSDGVSIHAWLMMRDTSRAKNLPTLVFFHGNAGNIGLRLPNALQMLQYLNTNILMVEYRGYGESDSVPPNEAGLKLDAEAALRFIVKHPKIDPSKIFLFGRSLGGAVAFHLADYAEKNRISLAGVIVENTFTSISEVVDHLMPYIAIFKPLVLRIRWESSTIVPRLRAPVLFLAGARDELIPHSQMRALYRATTRSCLSKIHVVKDGTHNETWLKGGQEYWEAIRIFLSQAMKETTSASDGLEDKIGVSQDPNLPLSQQASDVSSTSSGIPIMPSNVLNIAQESMRTGGIAETADKKDL